MLWQKVGEVLLLLDSARTGRYRSAPYRLPCPAFNQPLGLDQQTPDCRSASHRSASPCLSIALLFLSIRGCRLLLLPSLCLCNRSQRLPPRACRRSGLSSELELQVLTSGELLHLFATRHRRVAEQRQRLTLDPWISRTTGTGCRRTSQSRTSLCDFCRLLQSEAAPR
ncbi:hypothetical protein V8C26DRAFT_334974 [Trichoderma gracile]